MAYQNIRTLHTDTNGDSSSNYWYNGRVLDHASSILLNTKNTRVPSFVLEARQHPEEATFHGIRINQPNQVT